MGVRLKQYARPIMGMGGPPAEKVCLISIDIRMSCRNAGGPPAYLKAVVAGGGVLALRLFNGQRGADEPSALRHPLSSQASMRTSPRTLWALDKK